MMMPEVIVLGAMIVGGMITSTCILSHTPAAQLRPPPQGWKMNQETLITRGDYGNHGTDDKIFTVRKNDKESKEIAQTKKPRGFLKPRGVRALAGPIRSPETRVAH